MSIRTRLILAFAYTLLIVIVALEVPLAVNLQRRASAELKTNALIQAQTIAAGIGGQGVDAGAQEILTRIYEPQPGERVIVVDEEGRLIADSSGDSFLGQDYATPSRPELVQALRSGRPVTVVRQSEDLAQEILATATPILQNGVRGAVRVTQSTAEVGAAVRRTILGLVVIGLAGLLGGMLVAYLLAGSLVRPLSRLGAVARRLGAGDLSARAGDIQGAREIREVGDAFDEMADRVQASIRAEREFVANASHQLRTPLAGMKLRIEAAMDQAPPGEVREELKAADREVDRLADIVSDLLASSRAAEGAAAGVEADMADVVQRAKRRWDDRASKADSSLEVAGASGVAAASAGDLDQILDNLIENAISYAPGRITIEAGPADGIVRLRVSDEGVGVPAEEVDRITERFYRGRGTAPGGTGLGLAIVRDLAERWGGSAEVTSEPGAGTRIEVLLPRA